jgi:hypothetical protein
MNERLFDHPRWLLRFFQVVERVPIPKWLLSMLIIFLSSLLHHLVAWKNGYVDQGQFDLSLSTHGLYFVVVPFIWIFLANRAVQDLKIFFSDTGKNEEETRDIVADFNSLPELSSAFVVAIGGLNGFFNYQYLGIEAIPLSEVVLPGFSALTWIISAIMGYMVIARMIRQASLMRTFYGEIEVDLFRPERIYALSRYGAIASAALPLMFYLLVLVSFPTFIFTPVGVVSQLLVLFTIILLFFIPLSGINRRMRQAKDDLLNNVNEDLRDLNARIHSTAKAGDYAELEKYQAPLSTLRNSREMIKAIPTWPWQPRTLRNLLAPLLFPVLVYLVQVFLDRVMGL